MIDKSDIALAHERIREHIRLTPTIDIAAGAFGNQGSWNFKLEMMQHSGSFKARGAFNNLLSHDVPVAGIVAASGGNHGAAVAYAAKNLGIPANIFVPEISSPVKIERIKSYGAEIHIGGAAYADALEASEEFCERNGALAIHAYDAAETLAGQGTLGLEWQQQVPELDTIMVAVGGGGLIGGVAGWYRDDVKIIAVEPETSCCLHAALGAGRPVDVEVSGIAADSLGARSIGTLAYGIAETFVDKSIVVSNETIAFAQKSLWENLRVATEPGGAAAFAAVLDGAYRPEANERVGILICGGNTAAVNLI